MTEPPQSDAVSIRELLEFSLSKPYPDTMGLHWPDEAAWYRAMYQYVGHLANWATASPDGSGDVRSRAEKAAGAARLLAWTAVTTEERCGGSDATTVEILDLGRDGWRPKGTRHSHQGVRLDRFRTEIAGLACVVLAGQLLVMDPPEMEKLEMLTDTLAEEARRQSSASQSLAVDTGNSATWLAQPLGIGQVLPLLQRAGRRLDSSRIRYNLACFSAEATRFSGDGESREPEVPNTKFLAGHSGLETKGSLTDIYDVRSRLLTSAWVFLHDAVLGADLSQWAWSDPSLEVLRTMDEAAFAAAAGPKPAPPAQTDPEDQHAAS